jgi:hypothetical protein
VGRDARTRARGRAAPAARRPSGSDPAQLPIVTRPLQTWDRPNLQVAVDVFLAGRDHELLGLTTPQGYDVGLTELARGGAWCSEAMGLGAADHVTVPLGEDESITCIQAGLWLVGGGDGDGAQPLAIMLRSSDRGMGEESDDGPLRVTDAHLRAALDELRSATDGLTRTLLGGAGA